MSPYPGDPFSDPDAAPMSAEADMSYRPQPKCEVCGRFAKKVRLIFTSGPEPEPDYAAGWCCDPLNEERK